MPTGQTASISTPSGVTNGEANPGLTYTNSTTNTQGILIDSPATDVVISMAGTNPLTVGSTDTYTIVVRNLGASNTGTGTIINDVLPTNLSGVSWTSTVLDNGTTGAGGVTQTNPTGSGSTLNDSINLPPGGVVSYTVTGTVATAPTGSTIQNTVTATPPAGDNDPDRGGVRETSTVTADYVATATTSVVGRYAFYNDSFFSTPSAFNPGFNINTAIATDKTALQPGQNGDFNNLTNYAAGLNGIFVDIAGLPNQAAANNITAADFGILVGQAQNAINTWTPVGTAMGDWSVPTVTAVFGTGSNGVTAGVTRVELSWPDFPYQQFSLPGNGGMYNSGYNANQGPFNSAGFDATRYAPFDRWVQVIVQPDANTGLAHQDVFYLGNDPGSTGLNEAGSSGTAGSLVNATDLGGEHLHPGNVSQTTIANAYDVNKSSTVDATDSNFVASWSSNNASAAGLLQAPSSPGVVTGGVSTTQTRAAATTVAPAVDPAIGTSSLTTAVSATSVAAPVVTPIVTPAEPVILVGDHNLKANTPNQKINVYVFGGEEVMGENVEVQVADGGTAVNGKINGPKITAVDVVDGTIFANNNAGQMGTGNIGPQVFDAQTSAIGGSVRAMGLLATVTVDTTGYTGGSFALMFGNTFNGSTTFVNGIAANITNGLINVIAPPPPPVVKGSISGIVEESTRKGPVGLAGWTVFIDEYGTGVYKHGDPTAKTDKHGDWSFGNLPKGEYKVDVEPQKKFTATGNSKKGIDVKLAAGQKSTGNVFGEQPIG